MTEEIKQETKTQPVAKPEKKIVTADRSVDFPSLDWGINAGEQRELPVEEEAQKIILANHHIKLI